MKRTPQFLLNFLNLAPAQAGLWLFLLAFFVRLAIVFFFHTYRDLGRYELERTAISLATTGVFGNPYAVPTGPTAHVSPGYPLLLAAVFKLFGTGTAAEIVKQTLASAVSSLVCAFLPGLAVAAGIHRSLGVAAGVVTAVFPAQPLVQIDGDWEAPYTALALMLVVFITVRLWGRPEFTVKRALLHGIAWGISLLFVSALLSIFVVFVWASAYFFLRAGKPGQFFRFAALEILIVSVSLAPWAIRNYRALGEPILTRTNFGLELYVSNNDLASPDQRVNYLNGVYGKYHPLLNINEAVLVREVGEVAYNKQAGDKARQWIRTHPIRFLQLCVGRARCFWFYRDPTSIVKTAFLAGIALFGFLGLILLFAQEPVTGTTFLLILLCYPLPSYLVHVGVRQEYPIQWMMVLLSAVAIEYSVRKLARLRESQKQRALI